MLTTESGGAPLVARSHMAEKQPTERRVKIVRACIVRVNGKSHNAIPQLDKEGNVTKAPEFTLPLADCEQLVRTGRAVYVGDKAAAPAQQ